MTVFVIAASVAPQQTDTVINTVKDWVATNLGWYYVLTAGIVVVFVLVIAFRRVGDTKIGPDHSQPRFGLFTWGAMLFAAGIGVDLMFFGVSGPATNFLTPPETAELSDEAARMAPLWTMFHYGVPGWAMYALMGMAFGLFAYRYHMPLSIRSALAPVFGRRIHGAVGHGVDIAAAIGTAFGIAVSLGIGVVFLNYGLSEIFGIPTSTGVQIALIGLSVLITVVSTVSGVDKGIRRLSELNVWLALALMAWIVVMGRTADLLNALVQNIGDFVARFPAMLMNTFAYSDGAADLPADQWQSDWTLFFWAWWIAWAPFVGLFLARISRGRTLRQFILGVLIIPFTFIAVWISIFGNAALGFFRDGDEEEFLETAVNTPESGFFLLLQQYPGATFAVALAVVTGLLFYVTSADSGSLVMANITSKPTVEDSDGPPWLRIVWAVLTGALTLVMLLIGGVYTLQAATVLIGLPFSVIMYLLMFSIWRVLGAEAHWLQSRALSLPGALSDRAGTPQPRLAWRNRLKRRMSFPTAAETQAYVENTAAPAISEVAEELRELGLDVAFTRGEHPEYPIDFVDLLVKFPGQDDFKYQAYPVPGQVPNFAVNLNVDDDVYFTLEIFSATGSRGHNILGYTKEQVIADVLDAYDMHVEYMSLTGDRGTPTAEVHATAPALWKVDDDNSE